ncbi:hypothetical protein VTK73DRAFT_2284 [Phialemonium thermophilum]|uniref:Transcription factor tau subunit sfc1 n=1 Tax=Phialemonium thermophilum TaxID=223376 RepID=A0ABR3X5M1_9PEZI
MSSGNGSSDTRARGVPQDSQSHAPTYSIPTRRLAAVEHPMIIKDLDKGIATFGQTHSFTSILKSTSPRISVPLYFRPDNPTVRPLTSHNATTHNVVVKVIVPKRTGRKRKRGTDEPFYGGPETSGESGEAAGVRGGSNICSVSRLDAPRVLRRKLLDNIGKYAVEPIGIVRNTHRYRGSADFQYSMGNSRFMNEFVKKVLPGSVPLLRQFSLQPGIDQPPKVDLIPPPIFTPIAMPFPYNYSQNPYVRAVDARFAGSPAPAGSASEDDEYDRMVNTTSKAPAAGYFIGCHDYPVPTGPRSEPNMDDPQVAAVIQEMRKAMEERPIWTRRSMLNRLNEAFGSLSKRGSLLRSCMHYAGYQFKGGPWRDSLVRYGVDPRSDPKYRIYQTLIFKLHKTNVGNIGKSWQSVRREEVAAASNFGRGWQSSGDQATAKPSHEFDGKQFSTDGKVWQVCDITDPLLARLFSESPVLPDCDAEGSGFYPALVWAIAKGIMKRKMLAIRFGRQLDDAAFEPALKACKEACEAGDAANSISIPLPDLQLTAEERAEVSGRRIKGNRRRKTRTSNKVRASGYSIRNVRMSVVGQDRLAESADAASDTAPRDSEPADATGLGSGAAGTATHPGSSVKKGGVEEGVEEDEETLQDILESDEEESASESEMEEEEDVEDEFEDIQEDNKEEDEGENEDENEDDNGYDEDGQDYVEDGGEFSDLDADGRSGLGDEEDEYDEDVEEEDERWRI